MSPNQGPRVLEAEDYRLAISKYSQSIIRNTCSDGPNLHVTKKNKYNSVFLLRRGNQLDNYFFSLKRHYEQNHHTKIFLHTLQHQGSSKALIVNKDFIR